MTDDWYTPCYDDLDQILHQRQRELRTLVTARALYLFGCTDFRSDPLKLPTRLIAYNKRITAGFATAEFSIDKLNNKLVIAIADTDLWKQLRYGTLWFAPILQLQEDLSNTVFDYISGIY